MCLSWSDGCSLFCPHVSIKSVWTVQEAFSYRSKQVLQAGIHVKTHVDDKILEEDFIRNLNITFLILCLSYFVIFLSSSSQ